MTPVDNELRQLGAEVRDALSETSPEQAARQRARFLASDDSAGLSASSVPRWTWVAAVAAVLVLTVMGSRALLDEPVVEPVVVTTSPISDAPKVARAVVTPDVGTPPETAVVPPPARSEPETVVLESGRISVEQGTARRIVAGPYVVTSGSDSGFELTWDAAVETLTLEVGSGEVTVTSVSSHHVAVAGDTVRSTADEFLVVHTSAKKQVPEPKVSVPAWVRAAKRGEYRDALTRAKAGRVLASLSSLSREELKLLADATRLGGGAAQSESVLLELRRRFPRSTDAKRAAFYLGRLYEDAGRHNDAVQWYRDYLKSAATGSFAAQARGRVVKVLSRQGTAREARSAAREYLEHHPKGAYAALALRLTGASSTGVP